MQPEQLIQWWCGLSAPLEKHAPLEHACDKSDGDAPTSARPASAIVLPEEVIRQLKHMLGASLPLLSAGHLQEALNSYLDDGTVFDDLDGVHFGDMLTQTPEEQQRSRARHIHPHHHAKPPEFRARLEEERACQEGDGREMEWE